MSGREPATDRRTGVDQRFPVPARAGSAGTKDRQRSGRAARHRGLPQRPLLHPAAAGGGAAGNRGKRCYPYDIRCGGRCPYRSVVPAVAAERIRVGGEHVSEDTEPRARSLLPWEGVPGTDRPPGADAADQQGRDRFVRSAASPPNDGVGSVQPTRGSGPPGPPGSAVPIREELRARKKHDRAALDSSTGGPASARRGGQEADRPDSGVPPDPAGSAIRVLRGAAANRTAVAQRHSRTGVALTIVMVVCAFGALFGIVVMLGSQRPHTVTDRPVTGGKPVDGEPPPPASFTTATPPAAVTVQVAPSDIAAGVGPVIPTATPPAPPASASGLSVTSPGAVSARPPTVMPSVTSLQPPPAEPSLSGPSCHPGQGRGRRPQDC
ncbi:putative membrane protein [Candidatus Protofrankia californiensis]|uniref:Putative membrane protein n=1 Tax=Candidatus Protofrankia californiensis TaxID=1839754 RepID=A0A1C3NUX7_9ACTN|nr:putative membrane protein [Candidatus Protofrankia californiensis]